jgi:hypothetical protein
MDGKYQMEKKSGEQKQRLEGSLFRKEPLNREEVEAKEQCTL